jgi:hypothetical protein
MVARPRTDFWILKENKEFWSLSDACRGFKGRDFGALGLMSGLCENTQFWSLSEVCSRAPRGLISGL